MNQKVLRIVGRVLAVLLITVVILAGSLYVMLYRCCNGPSDTARNVFVTTLLETGKLKFLVSWVCSDETVQAVVKQNSMGEVEGEVELEQIGGENSGTVDYDAGRVFDENGICVEKVSGAGFSGKMMIIKDPSQVRLSTSYNNGWSKYGLTLDELVKKTGAVAGINGGIYVSTNNEGGEPLGVVVQDGQVLYNDPYALQGLWLIGMNSDADLNRLVIKDLKGMTDVQVREYIASAGIRDAVVFQDEASDRNNHFVPLIVNGEAREIGGFGSGANPRTVIGQRQDGAILMLVTDGRGADGHIGATAGDLIAIMQRYGAHNAANLDGGSSTCMFYNNVWEMSSVTFYYQNSSWRLPTGFVVMPKTEG
ncbi:MAG: phosphodiester glycosidase family protein [Clostridia bacterium]|nr:phosphodiester glycosidase family protein [Clostridia bacterium]